MKPVTTIPGQTGSTDTIDTYLERAFSTMLSKIQSIPIEILEYITQGKNSIISLYFVSIIYMCMCTEI